MVWESVCQINSPAVSSAITSSRSRSGSGSVARCAHAGPARLLGFDVVDLFLFGRGLKIQAPEALLALLIDHRLVEALACLAAQVTGLDQRLHDGHAVLAAQHLAILVVGHHAVEVLADHGHDINADQVTEAEGAAPGTAEQRAGQSVDLLHGVAVFNGIFDDIALHEAEHAVGDEVWRVLADDHALAQYLLREAAHALDDRRVCVGRGDDLQQMQVARRVEEVGAQEALLEARRCVLRQ